MALARYNGNRNQEFDSAYSDCAQYGKVNFWDERYVHDSEPFEWYYPYQYFRSILIDKLQLDMNIMIAGCGSSNMLEDMAVDGFEQLTGVDFSRVVLNQMEVRCEDLPQISLQLGTVEDLNYPNEFFEAIVDKALFDSIACSEEGQIKITQYVNEVERILTDTGIFIVISNSNPDEMLKHLEQYDIEEPNYSPWYIEVQAVGMFFIFKTYRIVRYIIYYDIL
jgi:ubiquinone/menaquinone biosynthesis C-methylase UbiE